MITAKSRTSLARPLTRVASGLSPTSSAPSAPPKADNAWTLTAIDLETGQTVVKDVLTVDALSTIMLRTAIEAMYPGMRFDHVFLDNARYHHAKLVQAWAGSLGMPDQTAFRPALLPASNARRLQRMLEPHGNVPPVQHQRGRRQRLALRPP